MFNLQGSEIIFILLLALVVLGPEKLPGAIKRAMETYHELRKLGSGFQSEFKSAIEEPMREMRATADLIKDQADPKRIAEDAERDAAAAASAADAHDASLAADPATGEAPDEAPNAAPDTDRATSIAPVADAEAPHSIDSLANVESLDDRREDIA